MASAAANDTDRLVLGAAVRAVIAASPEELWAWIADPTRHPQLAGSGEPQSITVVGGQVQGAGTQFEAQQKVMGVVRYVSRSEVVGFEPNRRFHFRTAGHADWDFLLEPTAGGTLITHRYRFEPARNLVTRLLRPILRRRTRQTVSGMVGTLRNLARLAGAPPPTSIQVSYDPPVLNEQ